MAQAKFTIYLGGLEASPIYKEVHGRFLVLGKKEVGANKSFTAFAMKPASGGVDELIPLELASAKDDDPYYVLDKEVSLEYLVYIDTSSRSYHTEEVYQDIGCSKDVVDLTDDKESKDLDDTNVKLSISSIILDANSPSGILQKMLGDCEAIEEVLEIPEVYNGNVVYELPPVLNPLHSKMYGMEQSHDGHVWTRPFETHVKFPGVVRKSSCGGALECVNPLCGSVATTGSTNRTAWKGNIVYVKIFLRSNAYIHFYKLEISM